MPKDETPAGASPTILRAPQSGPLHGNAIAQPIRVLSSEVLHGEERALYPALRKILMSGWATSEWAVSETSRGVRFYAVTAAGRKRLETELAAHSLVNDAIQAVFKSV